MTRIGTVTCARFVLMALGAYAFGDLVVDESAFSLRVRAVLSERDELRLVGDGKVA